MIHDVRPYLRRSKEPSPYNLIPRKSTIFRVGIKGVSGA